MRLIGVIGLLVGTALCASACADTPVVVEKPFEAGGQVEMQLGGGNYELRPAADSRIRVTLSKNVGSANAVITIDGTSGHVLVRDTPFHDFRAIVEVPARTDLVVHLSGGTLSLAGITGHKLVENTAGNTNIRVGDPRDYAQVDATVKAGNIDTDAFGRSTGGLFPHLSWSGPGRYSLQVALGAGNVELRR